MPKLSPAQIAGVLVEAGWPKTELPLAIAIVLGESGGNTDALGDGRLRTAKWGYSVGLFQIRSINAERGKGTVRDHDANLDPVTNARHALIIRRTQGLTAWTIYNTGAYMRHLAAATTGALTAIPWAATKGLFRNSPVGEAVGAARGLPNPLDGLDDIRNAITFVTDRKNWIRVGLFISGLALLIVAVIGLAGAAVKSPAGQKAVKTATKVAVTKKVS